MDLDRSNRPCEAKLFHTFDDLKRALNNKLQVDVFILDFEKAFDKVPHTRLIHKLATLLWKRGDLL